MPAARQVVCSLPVETTHASVRQTQVPEPEPKGWKAYFETSGIGEPFAMTEGVKNPLVS
jgi:hypothetical protein